MYAVFFAPDALEPLAAALSNAGLPVSGYSVQGVMIGISERPEAEWAAELMFDSERDLFSVSCHRKAPLVHLIRRLSRCMASRVKLRRAIAAASVIGHDR